MRIAASMLCATLAALMAAGCAHVQDPAEPPPDGEPAPAPAATPAAGGHPAFCLELVHAPAGASEGPVALARWGREITRLDYDRAYRAFLGPREPAPELEEMFRAELSRELMLLRWLEDSRATLDGDFRVDARSALRRAAADLAMQRIDDSIAVTEEDIAARYTQRAAEYQTPPQVQVRVILVPSQAEARALMQRIEAGEGFRTLAAAESKHESRDRGGDLPAFARGAYIREFEDLAFSLAPGETGTVATSAGTFVMQKAANIPAALVPLDDVRETLRQEILEEKRARRLREIEASLGP